MDELIVMQELAGLDYELKKKEFGVFNFSWPDIFQG